MKSEQLHLQLQPKPLHPYAVLDSLFELEEAIAASIDCNRFGKAGSDGMRKSAAICGKPSVGAYLQPSGNPYANIDSDQEEVFESKSGRNSVALGDRLLAMSCSIKKKRSLSDEQIEELVRMIHRSLWKQRNELNGVQARDNPVSMLDPGIALAALGYKTSRPATLGTFSNNGVAYEIAGQINQTLRTVEISQQFPRETQYFTAAHELAHAFIHEQSYMHRDRPLNGVRKIISKDLKERQADRFATYYLMPAKLIRQYFYQIFRTQVFRLNQITAHALNFTDTDDLIRRCRDKRQLSRLLASTTIYDSKAVLSMSEIFNVSTEAMAIRIEELGLVDYSK